MALNLGARQQYELQSEIAENNFLPSHAGHEMGKSEAAQDKQSHTVRATIIGTAKPPQDKQRLYHQRKANPRRLKPGQQ